MDRNIPLPRTFYKDFKGHIFQILCIAKSCVDKRQEVVYQQMFPPFDILSEPLESFMQETYNTDECSQKYKFEQIDVNNANTVDIAIKTEELYKICKEKESVKESDEIVKTEEISDSVLRDALLNGTLDKNVAGKIPDAEIAQRGFMEMLDADTYHDKYIIFSALKNYLNKRLLNNIAVSLDIVLDEEDEEKQYESIRRCLMTFERYETNRLRYH